MSLAIGVIVPLAAFVVCAWSGRTFARHYQDRWEVAAALAVGVCLFAALAMGGRGPGANATGIGWPEAVLGLAMAAGLIVGYYHAGVRGRK